MLVSHNRSSGGAALGMG